MLKQKIVSFILSAIITFSAFSCFAATDINAEKNAQKADLEKKLEAMAEKYGGRFEILDEVPNTSFKYANVEEFEKAIESFKEQAKTKVRTPIKTKPESISESESLDTSVSASAVVPAASKQRICTEDNYMIDAPVNLIGMIRQKIVANTVYNNQFKLYTFQTITSQTSYIYGASGADWTWTQDATDKGIIDSSRTLWGKINGHITLKAAIGGFGVGFTFDQEFYNEWYAEG